MKQSRETIEGLVIDPFSIHTMLVTTIPGSEVQERVAVTKILVTDKGELVFVSNPFKNLARKDK